ncbi:MAG TPA: lipid-binding SYLF domain-containing protein [Thermodesulfovibrionales bacterium]|nr:lipid-binding SYLF domain-containing protein [Thermodesulfovibrionales bacterium]
MRRKGQGLSFIGAFVTVLLFIFGVFFTAATPVMAADVNEAQGFVDKARVTFNEFMRDSNYGWLHEHLKEAKGLLIFPQVIKGGFFLGGSGGTGVLVARDAKTGDWSQPAFYTIGSVTFGLQIGGEAAEVIMMAMSQKAIDSLFASSFKLGGDTSITLGPVGAGAKGNITADFISFAKSKGLYAGLNLEGSVVDVRDSLNRAYYGKEVRPVEIVVEKKVSNKGSSELRTTLKKAVK